MISLAITIALSFFASLAAAMATKVWLHERIAIIGTYAGLLPSKNMGIAFGINLGPHQNALILAALILVAYIAVRTGKTQKERIGFGLILGGGFANAVDRSIDGYVNDMIQIGSFPIFNVADVCINLGIILLLVDSLQLWHKNKGCAD